MTNIAIIGAGPYGLSVAAHFRRHGIPFRIFGRPMDSWVAHMPQGMMLKSDGFASNIYDPDSEFTLKQFCAERGIEYRDTGLPVHLKTFAEYGLAFRERMVPELEDRLVVGLDHAPGGFRLRLDNGENVTARRVVLAVGITNFWFVPTALSHLPSQFLSHSFCHHQLAKFQRRKVVVIGGGASALDMAALLHDAGAQVQLISRKDTLKFHSMPTGKARPLWQRIRHPSSGLGPGMRSWFFSNAPAAFYFLPEALRLHLVRTTLGPSGGWFIKEKVLGQVPLMLGYAPLGAETRDGVVRLRLQARDGTEREIVSEHIVAATGYKVDLERLSFLAPQIRLNIRTIEGSPALSPSFESSVPGLYFVGVAAANSFGPVMRFAFGAGFAARKLTQTMVRSASQDRVPVPVPVKTTTEMTTID
jgi:Pyridine nucleotide-disulphide oxidoreductase